MTNPHQPPDEPPVDKTVCVPANETNRMLAEAALQQSRVGQTLGEFKLLRCLGRGGMAEVWLAEQAKPKRQVALKFMRAELMSDPLYVKRFEREADAAAGLTHANIVQVYATGTIENQHYIAQEYVDGQTLREYLQKLTTQRKRIAINVALQILRQTAAALEAAAANGIVHRDIKPENIMLTEKGVVKVADFGLAQFEQGGEKLHLTQADTTMGTPLYMSPEQIRAEKLDQRSDLYSLGVMAYHMLCGQTPFKGESAMAVAVQHLNEPPPSLQERRTDIPKPLCDLVHRLLKKKPEERYQTFTEVLEDIRSLARAAKSGTLSEVSIAEPGPDGDRSAALRLYGHHPWLTLALLLALTGSASAGVGWLMRTRVKSLPPMAPKFEKLASAEDEYLRAMFLANSEEAWKSIGRHYRNSPADALWVERAEEQLLLYYLKDKSRVQEGMQQCDTLERLNPENQRLVAEARLGRAYLAAGQGDLVNARNLLSTYQTMLNSHLQGTWRALYQDVNQQVYGGPSTSRGGRPGPTGGGPPREPGFGGFGMGRFDPPVGNDAQRPSQDRPDPPRPSPGDIR